VREEIIAHSSGMIHDFNELETRIDGGVHLVILDVWVAKSEIANRVLSRSKDTGRIEGERLSQQIESFKETRGSGDNLIRAVLRDFPSRAFRVSLDKKRVVADSERVLHLIVPVRLDWEPAWLKSLTAAAVGASHQPSCHSWWFRGIDECVNRTKLIVGTKGGYFDDEVVEKIAQKEMWDHPPRLLLTILDSSGNALLRDCWTTEKITAYGAHFFRFNRGLVIDPYASARVEMSIDLRALPTRELDRVQVDLVRDSNCPAPRRR
jgi:hypothetical protein